MRGSRLRTLLRRGFAAALVAVLAAVAWFVFVRDDGDGEGDERPARPPGVSAKAGDIVRGLDREEQVDQVLLLGFDGVDASAPIVAELRERQLGGVLVGPQNGASPELLQALRRAGRADGRIPPLMVAAQEGGIYRSFPELPPAERAIDIGDEASPERAQAWAAETARALAAVGFDLNLFPVADVATLDSPAGGRAFSDDSAADRGADRGVDPGLPRGRAGLRPASLPRRWARPRRTRPRGPPRSASTRRRWTPVTWSRSAPRSPSGRPRSCSRSRFYSAYDPVTPAALTPEVTTDAPARRPGLRGRRDHRRSRRGSGQGHVPRARTRRSRRCARAPTCCRSPRPRTRAGYARRCSRRSSRARFRPSAWPRRPAACSSSSASSA